TRVRAPDPRGAPYPKGQAPPPVPVWLLRWQRARVPRAELDPSFELALRAHGLALDAQPARHLATAHHHRARARLRGELVRGVRVDADEEAALAARSDRHVAADEEGEAAEHLLLGEVRLAGDQLPYAVR